MKLTIIADVEQLHDLKDALDTASELYTDKILREASFYSDSDIAVMKRQEDLATKLINLMAYPPVTQRIDLTT